ncbi:saccharopine dehydrogenase family protein [Pseudonocardia dioxanivorans]|uniref:saccharopine dehydrogenase family protein n=1 Tax=Pseudonocardia dioxanivorans TaxID=240495 RepID=UPI000CD114E9|nr:NAD(P)H-binding protein [Pseudonocardia dioxanivorans]
MTGRIVLLGATGYTGGRTAEAMVARGLRPVLAGRDPDRIGALSARLGDLPTAVADVTDAASIRALLQPGDVLVTTVGPFLRLGAAAVAAAVDAGAVYLDSTGEPPFIREVHEVHGPRAATSGAALLTAFGNDYVPGVLAGALALRDAGPGARRVDVGYFLTGAGRGRAFSRGTVDSVVGIMNRPTYAFRDGGLREEAGASRMRTFLVDGRPRPGVTIGASEQFALPRLAPALRTVDVYLGWFGAASPALHASRRITPLLGRVPVVPGMTTALLQKAVARMPAAPDAATLERTTSHFVAEVFDHTGTLLARTHLTSPDGYAITAGLLAWGAGRAAEHGVAGTGALDAVTAFGLDDLAAGAAEVGIVPVQPRE